MFDYTDCQFLDFTDLSGGVNTADMAEILPNTVLTRADNVYFTTRGLEQRPPYRYLAGEIQASEVRPSAIIDYQVYYGTISGWTDPDLPALRGLHCVCAKIGDFYRLLVLKKGDGAPAWTSLHTSSVPFVFSFYRVGSVCEIILFHSSGTSPKRIVLGSGGGLSDSNLGLPAPTTSNLTVSTTFNTTNGFLNVTSTDKLYYKFVFEYLPSAVSTANGFSALDRMETVNCSTTSAGWVRLVLTKPSSGATNAAFVHIYRAPKNNPNGVYRYIGVAQYIDGAGYTFDDNVPFGAEGDPAALTLSNADLSSLYASSLFLVKGRFFLSVSGDEGKLMWSEPGCPDVWPTLNYVRLEGAVSGVVEFNRRIFVFTTAAVYEWNEQNNTAYLISRVGCDSPTSLAVSAFGVFWKHQNRVYFANFVDQYGTDGDFPLEIGYPIRNQLGTLSGKACCFQDNYLLPIFSSSGQSVWVFNSLSRSWTNWPIVPKFLNADSPVLYGIGTVPSLVDSAVVQKSYLYEFDYVNYLAGTNAPYKGRDWRDHVTEGEARETTVALARDGIVLGDGFVWFQPLAFSCFLKGEGAQIKARCIVLANSRQVNISHEFDTSSQQMQENMLYNTAKYQGLNNGNPVGDAVYAGSAEKSIQLKRRWSYPIRATNISVGLYMEKARGVYFNGWRIYYRSGVITV